nr:DUF5615 family PIN-like protein [Myxacorys almedinensis]
MYIDEDSEATALVQALHERGIDVLTTLEVKRLRYPDDDQLRWATEQGRVIYTSNVRDFYQLHTIFVSQEEAHAGIIMGLQQRYSIGRQLRGLGKLIEATSAEEMHNQVEFLSRWIED